MLDRFFSSSDLNHAANPDGIIELTDASSVVYDPWLDLSNQEDLRESLGTGVAYALKKHTSTANGEKASRTNIYDLSRGGWQALCPLRRDSSVLDFGTGLGAVSRSLARNVGQVVGMDACYERLMVNAAVNRELGIDNIQLAFGNDKSLSHFNDNCLDGMVLNGVLEWVPEQVPGNPRHVQRQFLRECRRILKPDGWIYIGIENRCGFRYFLGRPDDHVNLLFSSLMPRWLANVYSKWRRGRPYRTYTYTPAGMKQLLEEAGFSNTTAYAPTPDYRHFNMILSPLADANVASVGRHLGIGKPWKQRLVQSRTFTGRFMPSIGVVASPELGSFARWLSDLPPRHSNVNHVYTKYDQASFWYRHEDNAWRIRDLALSSGAASKLRRISALAESVKNSSRCPHTLRDWHLEEQEGFVWADRPLVKGKVLAHFPRSEWKRHLELIISELRCVHQLSDQLDMPAQGVYSTFIDYAPNAEQVLSAGLMSQIVSMCQLLDDSGDDHSILMHGDCNPGNTVLTKNGVQFIDWEWSRVVTFPGYDVLKFLWYDSENPQKADFFDTQAVEKSLHDNTARKCALKLHEHGEWERCVLIYWAIRLARSIGRFHNSGVPFPQEWADRVIEPTVASISRTLAQERS